MTRDDVALAHTALTTAGIPVEVVRFSGGAVSVVYSDNATSQQKADGAALIAGLNPDVVRAEMADAAAHAILDGTDKSPLGRALHALLQSYIKATGKTLDDVKAEVKP